MEREKIRLNHRGFPGGTVVKNLPDNSEEARDMSSMSGLGG